MSAPIRVVVVDDQSLVREGLVTLLESVDDIMPIAAGTNGEEAVAICMEHRPDVVLMDLKMPRLNGVEATRRIRSSCPDTEVVILTTYVDEESVLDALEAGAIGYLTKDAGVAEVARAIAAAASHQSLLDATVQRHLLDAALVEGRTKPKFVPPESPFDLTPREAQVLRCIAQGLSNREIAAMLFVGEATVKSHINHLFAKIGVRDRAQAVHFAYTHDLT